MKIIFDEILNNFKKNTWIFYLSIIILVIGFIMGLFLALSNEVEAAYNGFILNYFNTILKQDASTVSFLFKRIMSAILLLALVLLFSLNSVLFYLNFVILLYRAYILGLTAKLFVFGLGFNGVVFYLFLILTQSLLTSLSIIVYLLNTYSSFKCKKSISFYLKCLILSSLIATIGAIIEFVLLLVVFRPLNFYF